jgi:cleavage stimulation factor subunit 3
MFTTLVILKPLSEDLQTKIPTHSLDLIIKYRARIKNRNKWDKRAWTLMVLECRRLIYNPSMINLYRTTLKDLLQNFPTSVQYWKELIQFEIKQGRTERVKDLFRHCLSKPLFYVPLWNDYLSFIRGSSISKHTENANDLNRAFHFTIRKIGLDMNSGPLWIEYLNMLLPPHIGILEKNQEYSAKDYYGSVREIFHSCLTTPHSDLSKAIILFEQFETRLNPQKTINSEIIALAHSVEEIYRERKLIYGKTDLKILAVPPLNEDSELQDQYSIWKSILTYERSNPQRLEPTKLAERVNFAFEQALIPLYHYPDIWLQYAQFVSRVTPCQTCIKEALYVLDRAVQACPNTTAIRFMQTELLEQAGDKVGTKKIYERLCAEIESGYDDLGPEQGSLVWIYYMYFLRRVEEPIRSRELFLRAKNWKKCSWQIYVASAMMEWHFHKTLDVSKKIAKKIFEKGLEKFYSESDFINAYLIWLIGLGDKEGVRSLFERTLNMIKDATEIKKLWILYLDFEASQGDLGACLSVQHRMIDMLSKIDHETDVATLRISIFMRRFTLFKIPPFHPLESSYLFGTIMNTQSSNKTSFHSKGDKLAPERISDNATQKIYEQKNIFIKINENIFDGFSKRLTEVQQTKFLITNSLYFFHLPIALQKFITMIPHVEGQNSGF